MIQMSELNTNMLIIIGSIIVAVIILSIVIYRLLRSGKKGELSADYPAALNYLLNGEYQNALNKLKEVVQKDTANINAYIKIGDILRDQGQCERAIKIHRSLIIRDKLTFAEKIDILKSLLKDYHAAGQLNKAIEVSNQLLALTRDQDWVKEIQVKLYEESEEWENAFDLAKKLNKGATGDKNKMLALYKVEAGLKLTESGKEHDARLKFREALKIDNSCASAYLNLTDSYMRESRYQDALTELKKFINIVPALSYLSFDRIKEILFETGNFGEIESILKSLVKTNPSVPMIRFALADVYARKGEIERAVEECQSVLEEDPRSDIAKYYLVKYYDKLGKKEEALKIALETIRQQLATEQKFTCEVCGYSANRPYWHCPQCKEWNSFAM